MKLAALLRTTTTICLGLGVMPIAAAQTPIALDQGVVFHFRSIAGPNNTGFAHLDGINLGIWVSPADGTVVEAFQESSNGSIYPQSGTTLWGPFELPRSPSPALPTEFSSLYGYQGAAGDGLLGNWTLKVSNPSSPNSPQFFTTPSIANAPALGFVSSPRVTYSQTGQPTLHWENPGDVASVIDVEIQDLSVPREYFGIPPSEYVGFAPIVHQATRQIPGAFTPLPGDSTSYEVPLTFSSGLSLDPGHLYAAVIDRDLYERQTIEGAEYDVLLVRSRTFVNFSGGPVAGFPEPPSEVYLPIVGGDPDAGRPEFDFVIRELGPGRYFLDPDVAVGYEYVTGEGNPNFASVMLPDVGDGRFDLYLVDPTSGEFVRIAELLAGDEFVFAGDGVSRFQIRGIETSAALDPQDPSAFVTGLTFSGPGDFTGKMIPLTVAIPEPSTWVQFGVGVVLMAWLIRRGSRG